MNMRQKSALRVLCVLLTLLLLNACGSPAADSAPQTPAATAVPAPASTPEPAPEPTPEPAPDSRARLDGIRAEMDSGSYLEAFRAMVEFENEIDDPQAVAECETLYASLEETLRKEEPETGTVFERTFQYQGGGELRINAESGSVLMTVRDADKPSDYVRFYTRKGESSVTSLPAGRYRVSCEVGQLWFGEEDGFGGYGWSDELEEDLVFSYSSDSAWITNSVWTFTI